jgi:hypothetical protein
MERRLGHDPRTTAEKLRVASALADLPLLRESLRTGRRPWTAVRELVRVAVPKTEAEWIDATEQKSVRELERMVAGCRPGDGPHDPKDPALRKHAVRLEMTPELYARFREATDRIRKEVDASLSDEEAVAAMVDRVLGGPADEGRSPYQVSVTVCEHCGRTWQRSRGELLEVEAEVGERARGDGQIIGVVPAPDATHVGHEHGEPAPAEPTTAQVGDARALQTVSPRLRPRVFARAEGRCQVALTVGATTRRPACSPAERTTGCCTRVGCSSKAARRRGCASCTPTGRPTARRLRRRERRRPRARQSWLCVRSVWALLR